MERACNTLMILQSDETSITLLPALSETWKNGENRDFRTRCGVRVSMRFTDGVVTDLTLSADRDTKLLVKTGKESVILSLSKNEIKEVIKEGKIL